MGQTEQVSSPYNTKKSVIRLGVHGDNNDWVEVNTDPSVVTKILKVNKWPGLNSTLNGLQVPNYISEDYRVQDVCRYSVKIEQEIELNDLVDSRNDFLPSAYNDFPTNYRPKLPIILLLLESPHKDEYNKESFLPIAPAQGTTGRNISKNIRIVIEEINRSEKLNLGEYRLVICNPVPYQTSLYVLHRQSLSGKKEYVVLRNSVWQAIWNLSLVQKDFEKRLDVYKPYLIINACTAGLKAIITDYLLNKKCKKVYTTNHPSAWNGFNLLKVW